MSKIYHLDLSEEKSFLDLDDVSMITFRERQVLVYFKSKEMFTFKFLTIEKAKECCNKLIDFWKE